MIRIPRKFIDEMIEHSRHDAPNEACGILAGKDGKVEKIYRMKNADASPESYFMDSREQLHVQKETRNAGLSILAIYHSHLSSPARPSARDIELAFYADVSYIIISLASPEGGLADKINPSVRSFRVVEGKVSEEEILVDSR